MTVVSPAVRAPSQHAVELINAGFGQCRFIVSDGSQPAMCCGAPTNGGSWCKGHRAIVYETARQRVRPNRPAA